MIDVTQRKIRRKPIICYVKLLAAAGSCIYCDHKQDDRFSPQSFCSLRQWSRVYARRRKSRAAWILDVAAEAQQREKCTFFYVAVNKSGESHHLSRHEFGRLTVRIWDLELSADVGQQLPVPAEMIGSLRPEQALQSDAQQSVSSGTSHR